LQVLGSNFHFTSTFPPAPQLHLSAIAGNGWLHTVLWYH